MIARRTRPKRIGKRARVLRTRDLDALLRQVVVARDRKCRRCQATARLQVSHVLPKGQYPSMRYDLSNVLALCIKCHLYWWHKNPIEAREWIEREIGAEALAALRRVALSRRSKSDFRAIEFYLRGALIKLESGPS